MQNVQDTSQTSFIGAFFNFHVSNVKAYILKRITRNSWLTIKTEILVFHYVRFSTEA